MTPEQLKAKGFAQLPSLTSKLGRETDLVFAGFGMVLVQCTLANEWTAYPSMFHGRLGECPRADVFFIYSEASLVNAAHCINKHN